MNPQQAEQDEAPLEMNGVEAGYGSRLVLRGLDLRIRRGELVALLGGNGAGKSTVLRVVAGLVPVRRGVIWTFGESTTNLPPAMVQQRGVAYLRQGGAVFPNLTVAENLQLPRSAASAGPSLVTPKGLTFAELSGLMSRRAGLLSGGQRQMLAVEMILRQRPRLLLLDEPSAGLAPDAAERILDIVAEHARRDGAAVVLVEQKVRAAARVASRVVVLVDGKAREDPENLALLLGDQG